MNLLIQDYPLLRVFRLVNSWWRLQDLLDRTQVDHDAVAPAWEALIKLDRQWGDDPGADTHEAFLAILRHALTDGLKTAFVAKANTQRLSLPADLAALLEPVDEKVADFLANADINLLQAVEENWIDIASSYDIEGLEAPVRLSLMCDAALIHQTVYNATGNDSSLEYFIGISNAAMKTFRQFGAHPPYCRLDLDPRLQKVAARLAVGYQVRFARLNETSDLDNALALSESAVRLTHPSAPDFPGWQASYGVTLGYLGSDGFKRAAEAFGQAVATDLPGSPERARWLKLLGRAFLGQFRAGDGVGYIDQALDSFKFALDECTDHESHAEVDLVEVLLVRFFKHRKKENLLQAVRVAITYFDLSDLDIETEQSSAVMLAKLLAALLPSGKATGIVNAGLDALAKLDDDNSAAEAAKILSSFGGHLLRRYEKTEIPAHLDRVIRCFEVALAIDSSGSLSAPRLNDLAIALFKRFERFGDRQDFNSAFAKALEALELAADTDDAYGYHNTFGRLLLARYEAAGVLTDLREAVVAFERSIPETKVDRERLGKIILSGFLGNLGSTLLMLVEKAGNDAQLAQAIEVLTESLEVADGVGGDALVNALNGLAVAHHEQWRLSTDLTYLESAIAGWQSAVKHGEKVPPIVRYNLGNALLTRYEKQHSNLDLSEAITLLQEAVPYLSEHTPDRSLAEGRLAEAFNAHGLSSEGTAEDFEKTTQWSYSAAHRAMNTSAETCFRIAWDWGKRASARLVWEEASQAYQYALGAFRQLCLINLLRRDKTVWLEEAYGVATRAAYAFAKTGDIEGAVVALESGRGLLLSDTVGVDSARVAAHAVGDHTAAGERFKAAIDKWHAIGRKLEAEQQDLGRKQKITIGEVEAARNDLFESISNLRTVPGLEDFFVPPSFDAIRETARTPLIYLVPGQDGGMALLVDAERAEPECIWLAGLDEHSVGRQVKKIFESNLRESDDSKDWELTLDEVTNWLGRTIAPVVDVFAGQRVILIPTGALSFFPLHAAWSEDADSVTGRCYTLDRALVTYAPTALSLLSASKRPSSNEHPVKMLTIDNPLPSAEVPLDYSGPEAAIAAHYFQQVHRLHATDAKLYEVRLRLPGQHVAHFACHAFSNVYDPTSSGIILAKDEVLDIKQLNSMDLSQAQLMVLSACETGVPGQKAPDEVISIAAALFGAGVDGVVSSLWSVLDSSTLMLVTRFYEYWREEDGTGYDAGEALILAQRWIRDTTNAEKLRHWEAARARESLDIETYEAIKVELEWRPADELSFSAPDHWAAFMFTGVW